ncbi:MAG TPA: LuxR C-terminal-related transcriptional regulator [Marmoricola sp.]
MLRLAGPAEDRRTLASLPRQAEPSPEGPSSLAAKFAIPRVPREAVSRRELIEAAVASGCVLVAVTAPAGYGKSTLLAQWARAEDRAVAWLCLDRFDDDPGALLESLATACRNAGVCDGEAVVDRPGDADRGVERSAARLAATLRASPVPFVLMLDELDRLQAPACHEVLRALLSAFPPGSQLVTASRWEQPMLARLRVAGDVLEIGTDALALDTAGTREVLERAHVEVPADLVAALTDRTEGWPVGVRVAALVGSTDRDQAAALTGEDPYVADYLHQEAFHRQPRARQRFLRRTAVLDELTGPLCETVLGSGPAGLELRRIEAQNLFLVALDRRRHRYRYHRLFREFLLAELQRTEPRIAPTLRARAADWYESRGRPEPALEHVLHTSDTPRAARLVAELALPTCGAGRLSTLQRWLQQLGDVDIGKSPELAVVAGWVAALAGDPAQAMRWARVAQTSTPGGLRVTGAASFGSASAMLRALLCADGPEQMLADARFALEQEPEWSPGRTTALWLCGEAWLLAGRHHEARIALLDASATATRDSPDMAVSCCSELALLAMDGGDWREAAAQLRIARTLTGELELPHYSMTALALTAAARLAVHRGDLHGARRELADALGTRSQVTWALPHLAVRLRLQLARACLSVADPVTAREMLAEIEEVRNRRPALGALLAEVDVLRDTLDGSHRVEKNGALPLSPAELRLLPHLQTHLTVDQIAQRLFLSSHTVKTEVKAIYRKLGVSSRNDAVHRATAIGLLGGPR